MKDEEHRREISYPFLRHHRELSIVTLNRMFENEWNSRTYFLDSVPEEDFSLVEDISLAHETGRASTAPLVGYSREWRYSPGFGELGVADARTETRFIVVHVKRPFHISEWSVNRLLLDINNIRCYIVSFSGT